jgi:hypothetical protein
MPSSGINENMETGLHYITIEQNTQGNADRQYISLLINLLTLAAELNGSTSLILKPITLDTILSQFHPPHILTAYFPKIHLLIT